MKVLMMFPYAPLPPPLDLGGTKRNLPFLQENLKRHEVSVLSFGTPEEEKIFRGRFGGACRYIRFINRKRPRVVNALEQIWLLATGRSAFRQLYRRTMQRALDELVLKEKFDLIHCCVPMFGYFRFPVGVPVVSDTHEVTYDLLRRTSASTRNLIRKFYNYWQYKLGKPEEIRLCNSFDALITTTERDHDVFRRELPDQRMVIVQNGVGSGFLEYEQRDPEPCSMVFTGKMSFYPNDHGIKYFLDKILPLILARVPDARLEVVGAYPTRDLLRRASENIIVTGYVEDVRPYMARGQVYIIPLLIGGGIRGKALEAMAMKRPIVSTSIGCEGIRLRHEESALFADTPEEFAAAVLRLFRDPDLWKRLTENAYETVLKHYDWNAKGEELTAVYRGVAMRDEVHIEV